MIRHSPRSIHPYIYPARYLPKTNASREASKRISQSQLCKNEDELVLLNTVVTMILSLIPKTAIFVPSKN